ncbi:hypothetical protein E4T42_04714 [Aureobasidium subglaciale]|nr:hypothetical protein E4T42_04714 [Aureobasidium subglaciale]
MAAKTRSALIKSKSGLVVKRGRKNEEGPARMTRNATVAQETVKLIKLPAEIRLMIYDYALGTGTVDKSTGTRVIIVHMHRDWFKL